MAYRKTDEVIAEIEGRKTRVVNAATAVIRKQGVAALTSAKVAKQAKLSVGLIYKHFPDMDELRAHVFAQMLAHDLVLIREASDLAQAIRAWVKQLAGDPRSTDALAAEPAYRDGIKRELTKIIRAAGSDFPSLHAVVVCGAVFEASGSIGPRDVAQLTTALLRACGIRAKANA